MIITVTKVYNKNKTSLSNDFNTTEDNKFSGLTSVQPKTCELRIVALLPILSGDQIISVSEDPLVALGLAGPLEVYTVAFKVYEESALPPRKVKF